MSAERAEVKSPWRIPLAAIHMGEEEKAAVLEVLESGWLTLGPRTERFERELGAALGTGHVAAVSSGTAALHLAYLALGLGPGDEVIVPSLTFVATANAALACGASVVLADVVGPHDLCIDPEDIEKKITPRTKAIAVVHYAGFPCDMDRIAAIASRHGLAVVEDAAHAPLATWRGQAVGTLGDFGCFSFFSNKNMTTGEGGAVVTRDADRLANVRLLRSHGVTAQTFQRHQGGALSYDVVLPGYNYRIDEIRSALGLVQLKRLAERNERRRRLSRRYQRTLEGVVGLPFAGGSAAHRVGVCHIMPVILPSGTDRDEVRRNLHGRGIQTSVHYPPIHSLSFHRASDRIRTAGLPKVDDLAARELTLPLYPEMSEADVDEVCAGLRAALGR